MTKQDSVDLNIKDLSFINNINSLAVIGPSRKRDYYFLRTHAENYKGKIYAVHPKIKEISGFANENIYPSLMDIPEKVDYVYITVSSSQILNVIDECVEKGVKLASVFTAGFSDLGTEEGRKLEVEMIRRAKNSLRILGPNGMGMTYPKKGIGWRARFPSEPGNIAFIGQSGGISNLVVYKGSPMGIKFSKVFSYGNGNDVDFVDLLYFLSNDEETDVILCYLEGIKAGRGEALIKVLQQNKKPIVVLKAGKFKGAAIAANTHTAAITGEYRVWKAIFDKYSVIEADSVEQLLYAAKLIDAYGIFELKNIAVLSISGGYGVVLVDQIENLGMEVPPFSPEIQNQLNQKLIAVGTSAKNPLDIAAQFRNLNLVQHLIELVLSDKKIDGLIMDLPSFYLNTGYQPGKTPILEKKITEIMSLGHSYRKPIIPIIQRSNSPEHRDRVMKILNEKKIPVFNQPLEFLSLLPKISKCAKNKN